MPHRLCSSADWIIDRCPSCTRRCIRLDLVDAKAEIAGTDEASVLIEDDSHAGEAASSSSCLERGRDPCPAAHDGRGTDVAELDELDRMTADAFEGYVVRKDLAQQFKGAYPVPTYVGEFLLGRYCATTDEDEIEEGLEIVERLLRDRTVRAGEEELFKSRARERGTIKLIDLVRRGLTPSRTRYLATLPSLQLNDVRIADELVARHERMLTGGFYAEVDLEYDAAIAEESAGRPFGDRRPAPDPALDARRARRPRRRPSRVHDRASGSTSCCAASASSRTRFTRASAGRPAAAHGSVRRAQLQHGRARPARHRQVATSSSRSRPTRT